LQFRGGGGMSRRPTGSLEIGRRIRQARTAKKMSQAELAEKANLSAAVISLIECGRSDLRVQTLVRIIEALQVSSDSILRPNVPTVIDIGRSEYDELIADCSPQEVETILSFSRQLKETLRKNKTED